MPFRIDADDRLKHRDGVAPGNILPLSNRSAAKYGTHHGDCAVGRTLLREPGGGDLIAEPSCERLSLVNRDRVTSREVFANRHCAMRKAVTSRNIPDIA